jgi:aminoglycoside phosphotransferase (APT) family kinase protein
LPGGRLNEAQLIDLLTTPEVGAQLGLRLGPDARAAALSSRGSAFQVTSGDRRYVVRLSRDGAHLASLRREARIAAALQGRTALRFPNTQLWEGATGQPSLAIHTLIPGEPLVADHYTKAAPPVRERLVADLARFFRDMHAVPLERACDWLGIACETGDPAHELAPTLGKPRWFDAPSVREIRAKLGPALDGSTWPIFEQTVERFEALGARPEYMVFGHGDLHGYNVAVGEDELGARLVGVFDLENSGILDLHEDFFRLSLVSEPMLDKVLDAYQRLPGPTRALDRARIAVYTRAFLFYLMVGKRGERLAHLHRLLAAHLANNCRRDGGMESP